ncbi:MAG: FAD-dependent oxidoreductase [Pseudomonadota bacterium]|nr:FAD-dependent oxidoreductase [Pseudomonadota bacterium]
MTDLLILGAGLTGISTSFHLGHDRCRIIEKNSYPGGHIFTEVVNGVTWDEGPHISFTKHEYVKKLFEDNVSGKFLEYPVTTTNYYQGHWIPHPAQSNLFAVPEPLRGQCLDSFLNSRKTTENVTVDNYKEWLYLAFGRRFAETFPSAYTRKYWTAEPEALDTDWVGERVYFPSTDDVVNGSKGPLPKETHYIQSIRYPAIGGYYAYAQKMAEEANIEFNQEVAEVSFSDRKLYLVGGESLSFEKLIVTSPLPQLIKRSDAPKDVKEAADQLCCTSLLIVNVVADHTTQRPENWIYVYDESKWATRINCTEKLSPNNAPPGKSGIQVEVYFSKYRPLEESTDKIAADVIEELVEMGLVKSKDSVDSYHHRWVEWANVVFDKPRKEAQEVVLTWLEKQGLMREEDDLDPMTDWETRLEATVPSPDQTIFLAGRFAQWKYFWTDDCVLRGLQVAKMLAM